MSDNKQFGNKKSIQLISYTIEKIFNYPIIILSIIGIIGILIRLYYFPYNIPLALDATGYFWYAMDMSILGRFPEGYNFPNNGWPAFLSIFFSLYNSENFLNYMMLQRYLSITISVLTLIPVYLLCTRFFNKVYSLIGASLFVLEPRIIQNSLFGITEPAYILLGSLALFLFLSKKMTPIYAAFGVIALFSLVRYEGLYVVVPLSIMFFIRFRKDRKVILKYLIAIMIFLLVLLPMTYIRITTTGNDGLTYHAIESPSAYYRGSLSGYSGMPAFTDLVFKSLTNFSMYLIWVMIPVFGFFVPSGAILFFKKWNYEKTTVLLFAIFLILPALYAYSRGFQDTRYLYVMFPIFSILSLYTIKKINEKFRNFNLIRIIVIIFTLIISLLFLEHKNFDYEHELEAFKIAELVAINAKGVNNYFPEAKYVSVSVLSEYKFPVLSSSVSKEPKLFTIDGFETLEEFIEGYRDQGLTHLVVDNSEKRPDFLRRVFLDEKSYPYLIKEFDSHENGFTYYVKLYRINYDEFDRK
jgi:hypothetical protein